MGRGLAGALIDASDTSASGRAEWRSVPTHRRNHRHDARYDRHDLRQRPGLADRHRRARPRHRSAREVRPLQVKNRPIVIDSP